MIWLLLIGTVLLGLCLIGCLTDATPTRKQVMRAENEAADQARNEIDRVYYEARQRLRYYRR